MRRPVLTQRFPRKGRLHRRALTLLEIILVLTLMCVLGSMAYITVMRPMASQRLETAADQLRAEWLRARNRAMSRGVTYAFRCSQESGAYTVEPYNDASADATLTGSFGGTSVTGANIGFSDDNFWALENSQAYRADVTSLVTGNGAYAIANFRKSGIIEINGLSLIVFFDDGNAANNVDVALFNGNDANFNNDYDADNWNATLNGINYSGGAASLTLHVSDGQNFSPSDDGTLVINGVNIATGGLYQGNGVQFGDGAFPPNGALWDIETFDITSLLSPGLNSLALSQGAVNDALSLIVAQFNLPVGSAPDPDPVPAPAGIALFGLGLLALGGRRRRG